MKFEIITSVFTIVATFLTAYVTFLLYKVTKLLAVETTKMASASSQSHVVATLENSPWAMRVIDLNISNTGNATAYDISINIKSENKETKEITEYTPRLSHIDVLKPAALASTFQCEYPDIQSNIMHFDITWKNNSKDGPEQKNSYTIDMENLLKLGRVMDDNPLITIAKELQYSNKILKSLVNQDKRLKIDVITQDDKKNRQTLNDMGNTD
jgi:hypothetical protein